MTKPTALVMVTRRVMPGLVVASRACERVRGGAGVMASTGSVFSA